jgi:hypothetical protein
MAIVGNKDKVSPIYLDKHVLTPAEMQTNATPSNTQIKGSPSANPAYVPRTS